MKDYMLQNGTDPRLEARAYHAEQGLLETVEEIGDRASQVAEQTKAIVETTKTFSKPVLIGAIVASAAVAGGVAWAVAGRHRPSTLERLLAPKRRSNVLPMLGKAATSLALSAATTAARTILLAKLEHVIEKALEPNDEAAAS